MLAYEAEEKEGNGEITPGKNEKGMQLSSENQSSVGSQMPHIGDTLSYLACYQATPDTRQLQFR